MCFWNIFAKENSFSIKKRIWCSCFVKHVARLLLLLCWIYATDKKFERNRRLVLLLPNFFLWNLLGCFVTLCVSVWESRNHFVKSEWMLHCMRLCVCVRKNVSVCLNVCPRLIDTAVALRLIGSHGGCINILWRLTFDPEHTLCFRLAMLSASPHLHIFSPVYTCCLFSQTCDTKGKQTAQWLDMPWFSSSSCLGERKMTWG